MEKFIINLRRLLTSRVIIGNVIFGLISIIFMLLDKNFSFNPFIVALLYVSYTFSPSTFICVIITSLITSLIVSYKYCLEIVFIEIIFLIVVYISKIIKNNEKKQKMLLLIAYIIILILLYVLLDRTLYSLLASLSLGVYSYVLSLSGEKFSKSIVSDDYFLEDYDVIIIFSSLCALTAAFNNFSIFFIYLFLLLSKRLKNKLYEIVFIFVAFFTLFLFSKIEANNIVKLMLPFIIYTFISQKYHYVFLLVFTLFSFTFDKYFYMSSYYYFGVMAYFTSLVIPEKSVGKIKEYLSRKDELIKHKYNETSIELINILNDFGELVELLQIDSFDKKENIDDDYYMKKEHKRLFNKEISFFNQPIKKMMDVFAFEKKETKANYSIDKYCYSKPFENGKNGDFHIVIEEKEQYHSLLVDGMGHNETSKNIAQYVARLFLYMKRLSPSIEKIISCLNAFVKGKTYDEIFSTFDLLTFDLINGNYYSYQYGSFPCFLIRNKRAIKINQIYPPLGIISSLQIKPTIDEFEDGDIFVQLTDGFKDNVDKEIERFFRFYDGNDERLIIDYLFDYLNTHSNLEDDKTIVILKIKRNDEK